MYLNGIPATTIRKFGRWKSDTFLLYLQEQLAHFSRGVSSHMATAVPYHNIRSTPNQDRGITTKKQPKRNTHTHPP